MAARIADLVNETLAEGQHDAELKSGDILNLIDSGRSEGGSQATLLPHPPFQLLPLRTPCCCHV